jgi:hypothetical protein
MFSYQGRILWSIKKGRWHLSRVPNVLYPQQHSLNALVCSQHSGATMFSYTAYGLCIQSAIPLPELMPGADATAPDVCIRTGKINWSPRTQDGSFALAQPEEIRFFWKDVGTFFVKRGVEIIVSPAPGVEEHVLRLFLLGAVLAGLLHQRGLLLLHASAVRVNGGAVAFLGHKGWGKSTLAAAMQCREHELVADDVVAVDLNGSGEACVLPGIPQMKLWPDAVRSLGINADKLTKLHPQLEKRAYRVLSGFSNAPLSLNRLFVIGDGDRLGMIPLTAQETFIHLVRYSFLARYLQPTETTRLHFRQCSVIAHSTRAFLLERPRSLDIVSQMAELVERNVANGHTT